MATREGVHYKCCNQMGVVMSFNTFSIIIVLACCIQTALTTSAEEKNDVVNDICANEYTQVFAEECEQP